MSNELGTNDSQYAIGGSRTAIAFLLSLWLHNERMALTIQKTTIQRLADGEHNNRHSSGVRIVNNPVGGISIEMLLVKIIDPVTWPQIPGTP
jgi:hypothetical protein